MDGMNSEETAHSPSFHLLPSLLFVLAKRMLSACPVLSVRMPMEPAVFANNPCCPCKKSQLSRAFANITRGVLTVLHLCLSEPYITLK